MSSDTQTRGATLTSIDWARLPTPPPGRCAGRRWPGTSPPDTHRRARHKVAAAYETWWRTKTLEDLNAIGPAIATAIKARQHLQSTKDGLAGKAS